MANDPYSYKGTLQLDPNNPEERKAWAAYSKGKKFTGEPTVVYALEQFHRSREKQQSASAKSTKSTESTEPTLKDYFAELKGLFEPSGAEKEYQRLLSERAKRQYDLFKKFLPGFISQYEKPDTSQFEQATGEFYKTAKQRTEQQYREEDKRLREEFNRRGAYYSTVAQEAFRKLGEESRLALRELANQIAQANIARRQELSQGALQNILAFQGDAYPLALQAAQGISQAGYMAGQGALNQWQFIRGLQQERELARMAAEAQRYAARQASRGSMWGGALKGAAIAGLGLLFPPAAPAAAAASATTYG